jgi:hypothetical protein
MTAPCGRGSASAVKRATIPSRDRQEAVVTNFRELRSSQRIAPSQARKSGEVAIGGIQDRAVFYGKRRE